MSAPYRQPLRLSPAEAERLGWENEAFIERLVTCHGHERALAIVEGRDAATNADLAAWRNLGCRAAQ